MKRLARILLLYPGLVSFIGLALGVVGAYYSVELYKNLRTDLEELLPTTARSVVDLDEVTSRLESVENLAVVVLSNHPAESKRFVTDLAKKLEKAPKETISSVEYRITNELRFFSDRRALYMDLPDLKRVRDYIRDRISYEKELYNPLNIFAEREIPEPMLDFLEMQRKYDRRASVYASFPEGFYATPDEKTRVVLVYMPGKSSGLGNIHRLKNYVLDSIRELNPQSYAPDIDIKFTGGVQDSIEEQAALVADLELSTIVVTILVAIALWFFYRQFRAAAALLFSLLIGTLWTFGVAYHVVGYLNANSAFLGSIVIGNGINFGIIYLARYLEERRQGAPHAYCLEVATHHTAISTWTAALAAGLSYGSLMFTGFRGFKQFGIIGLIGMVLCWLSSFTLLPAFLTLLDRWSPLVKSTDPIPKSHFSTLLAKFVSRFPRPIWIFSVIAILFSIAGFSRFSPAIIETNLGKLRNKESMERGSGYLSKYVDEVFHRYLSPMVVLPRSREDARIIASVLKARKTKEGAQSLIANVQTLDDFIPADQEEKIQTLRETQGLLTPRILRALSAKEKKLVGEFLTPEAFRPVRESDLPELILSKFTERDGSVGKMVLVEPPLTHETLDGRNLIRFIQDLRGAADQVAPGSPVAGGLAISSDMIDAISRDGPRATLFAFIAVVLLVIVLFHNLQTISLVLFALIIGIVWLAGVIFWTDLKVNFLNFIALPITFGIGVDYGVNIFQRFRTEGRNSILRVLRDTGGAVTLCSFTTVVGYGSLLIAENQAFVSFGLLAIVGEATCLVAAIFSLPAFLLCRVPRGNLSDATPSPVLRSSADGKI